MCEQMHFYVSYINQESSKLFQQIKDNIGAFTKFHTVEKNVDHKYCKTTTWGHKEMMSHEGMFQKYNLWYLKVKE